MTTSTDSTITTKVKADWTWITSHILLLIVVAALIMGGIYLVDNRIAARDAANSSKFEQILAASTQQTQTLQKQLQTDEDRWSQLTAQILAQNAKLSSTISARNQTVETQVKTDATLSALEAAQKLQDQTKTTVTATGDTVVLGLDGARSVAASLDLLPVAQANLKDTQTQLINETQIASNAQADVSESKAVIAAQKTQISDGDKACQAQVTTLKADARKNKLKWFGIGVIVGLIGGHWL